MERLSATVEVTQLSVRVRDDNLVGRPLFRERTGVYFVYPVYFIS